MASYDVAGDFCVGPCVEVGAVDDFYELGGHSLLAMQFAGRLEAAAGVRVQMRHLAEAPTPRLLAKVVHMLQAAKAPTDNGTVGPARHYIADPSV